MTWRGLMMVGTAALLAGSAIAAEIPTSINAADVSERRQTALGLYLTSADASRALAANPEIVLIDVRTRAEFQFVGHPKAADANIPLMFMDAQSYNGTSGYGFTPNRNFREDVDGLMEAQGKPKDAPVFVLCRSGGRSARAVNLLAEAGYTNVWNVVDGFEGGKDKTTGHRTIAGWRHDGLPWTYAVHPDQAYPMMN